MNNLIYDIKETPKKWYEWIIYPIQMLLAIFVATVLIINICGTPIPTGLLGACVGTLTYEIITGFKSPMFISNAGATVSAVIGGLALGGGENYIAIAIGGVILFLVYLAFALIIKFGGKKVFDRIFPPAIVGAVTIVIGLNLAGFIPSYLGNFTVSPIPLLVALFTMFITALTTHYAKGFWKTIGFLVGLLSGFILSVILEVSGTHNFDIVNHLMPWSETDTIGWKWFNPNDFAFMKWANSPFEWSQLPDIILLFLPVSICAALEHYSDHKVLSNILGTDLTQDPGLHRTLIADGCASAVGTIVCGQPNTSYGESIATIGFSRVGSVWMTTVAALLIGAMGFIGPVIGFISAIPSAVFAGCAMILYGYIASSGLKTLISNRVNLEDNKNLIIVSVILTVGVSGIFLFSESFKGVSLAMVLGVVLNLILFRGKQTDEIK